MSTRERVADYVACHPGTHFSELADALDLATGQVQYHTRELRRADEVTHESVAGRTHFYPPGYDPWERRALALLRRETTRDVAAYLLREGPARPAAVAAALDLPRSTLAHHVGRLCDGDLVEKERGGGVTLHPTRPEHTAELLGEVTPSLPARMTDRFERLVDDLLSD